jgi:hypothetical protein
LATRQAINGRGDGWVFKESIGLEPFDQRLNPAFVNLFVQNEVVSRQNYQLGQIGCVM